VSRAALPALVASILTSFLALPTAGLARSGDSPFRDLGFAAALEVAQKEKKLVFVAFQSTTSEASRRLERMTIPESRVRAFLKGKVVAIRVDLQAATELAEKYRVDSAPTLLFVDELGLEVDRYVGYLDPSRFVSQARGTLEGKDAVFRAKARIDAGEKDPRVRFELAELLIDRGRHADALEQLLVCFDRGEADDPTFKDIRSARVLTRIQRLGQVFPTALDELARRANAAAKRVLEKGARLEDVDEAILIEGKLGNVDRLRQLYDALRGKPEGLDARKRLGPHVVVVLLADRRYAEALECLGSPLETLRARIAAHNDIVDHGIPEGGAETFERYRRDIVAWGTEAYEIALGAGKPELAEVLAAEILAFESKVGTYVQLVKHAVRAGFPEVAAEIGRQGLDAQLSPADKIRLREAMSGMPKK
jgi:thioredoxin-related protein